MRKFLCLLGMMLFFAAMSFAQKRTIIGQVKDVNGNPVPHASVTIKGSRGGAIADQNGKYSIEIFPNSRVIVFSGTGLEPIEYSIGNKGIIDAILISSDKNLSEVIVVGYGTQKKSAATANIAVINGAVIADKPVQSFEQTLAGRAAGVQVTIPNGVLNTPPVFRIQGTNSISLSSYPLIVVDGVVSFTGDYSSSASAGNALASINPNDIESIDILKDAAATSIYGSRGANGVVLITTKRGKPGKPKVSYDGSFGWTNTYNLPKELNATQYTDFKNMAAANNPGINTTNSALSTYTHFATANDAKGQLIDTKWSDYIYRTGFAQFHNLSLSGGNENTNYYFSTGYTDQAGVLMKNTFQRTNVLFNIDSRVNKVITVGAKISYSQEKNNAAESSGSIGSSAFAIAGLGRIGLVNAPNISPYNNDGSYNINIANNTVGSMNNTVTVGYYNPVMLLALDRQNSTSNHLQTNAYVQLKPLSWMTLKTLYGLDNLLVDNDIFLDPYHGDGKGSGGSASGIFGNYKTWVWTNTAQFDKTFGNHSLSLLVGNEQQRRTTTAYGINRTGLGDSAYTVLQAGGYTNNSSTGASLLENYLLSTFGRLNYSYNNKYFVSGNLRQDEYSALGVKKGVFYGASVGWELTKEKFWETMHLENTFSSFRIKGSYGKVGNNGVTDFASFTNYSSGLYGGGATLGLNSIGNPNLKWETSHKTNVGLSFGLFRDRLTADLNYYYTNIDGLILAVPQAPSVGVANINSGNINQNAGTMYNKGLEITLNGTPISKRDFRWNVNFNITLNKNVVTALAPGLTVIQTSTSSTETVSETLPNYSLGYLYVIPTAGVDPSTGKRIFVNSAGTKVYYQYYAPTGQYNYSTTADGATKYVSPTGATTISQGADAVLYKNTQPKYYGGFDNTFHYKGFDLDVLMTYVGGYYIYYGTNAGLHDQRYWNNATDMLNSWKKEGDITTIPKAVYNDNVSNGSAMPLDINVFKGDFVKLSSVQLSYNLPKAFLDRAKIGSVRLYVSGRNLAVITKYPGPDPEVSSNGNTATSQGVDRNTVGSARTFTFGLNIGF